MQIALHNIKLVKGHNEKGQISLEEEGILPAAGLQSGTATLALPWVSGLLAYPGETELASSHNQVSQFLKINQSTNLSLRDLFL